MKNTLTAYIGWLLILSALAFYFYGIGDAIYLSFHWGPNCAGTMNPFLASTMSSIQALLLTNLGIVLGIAVTKPDSALAKHVFLSANVITPNAPELKEKVQLFAVGVYLISLIACMVCWIIKGFATAPGEIVPLLAESGKMFVGVVLAYCATVFSK